MIESGRIKGKWNGRKKRNTRKKYDQEKVGQLTKEVRTILLNVIIKDQSGTIYEGS